MTLASMNPATGQILGEVPVLSRQEVGERIHGAREAQKEWGALPIQKRVEVLGRFGRILAEEAKRFAILISQETGKSLVDSLTAEILGSLLWLDYVCRHAPRVLHPRKISSVRLLTHESHVVFDPLGVVGIITPWNFPVFITLSSALSALAAGNAVVTKPSHFTPLSVLELERLFLSAGLPSGLFQVLTGNAETGQAMIEAGINQLVFTGSAETGRKVASACAERLIPYTLELGGKDPMIVLEDAPMPRAVHGALYGGFCHAGQICMSVERLYVAESIARPYLEALVEEARRLLPGKEISPIQNEPQRLKIEAQLEEAARQGATVLVGGKRDKEFFLPTILTDVADELRVAREETFGPVLLVKTFKDEEEAVRLANAGPFGLCASVWSRDLEKARKIAGRLQAGSVYINDHITPAGNPRAPWGGMKESGVGTQRGEWGLYSMVKARHVARSRFLPARDPFWFPRRPEQESLALGLIQALFSPGWRTRFKGLKQAVLSFLRLRHSIS